MKMTKATLPWPYSLNLRSYYGEEGLYALNNIELCLKTNQYHFSQTSSPTCSDRMMVQIIKNIFSNSNSICPFPQNDKRKMAVECEVYRSALAVNVDTERKKTDVGLMMK